MQVSGKITHSFYCFLKVRGLDVSRFFELTSLEMEFLRDPEKWMDIAQVEFFLKKLVQEYASQFVDQDFLGLVGHSCLELRAWGELDSVLKMRKAEPVYRHLPVFLSYFISEGFSVVKDRSKGGLFSFKCNLSSEEYPLVTEYLRAALEALPTYTSRSRAEVSWIRHYIQVKWEDEGNQISLFNSPSEINIKPELLSDLREFIEKVEKELYNQREQLAEKQKEIQKLKDQLLMQGIVLPESLPLLLQQVEQSVLELRAVLLSADPSKELPSQLDSLRDYLSQLKQALGS